MSFAFLDGVLRGDELPHNRDVFWIAKHGDDIIGTGHVTQSLKDVTLGGLGEVAVHPNYRGLGVAKKLCQNALDWFEKHHGTAIFLGTSNAAAGRLYASLGWEKIPNSAVMLRTNIDIAVWNSDYYQYDSNDFRILDGSASDRVGMIPLVLSPNRKDPLDGNIPLRLVTHAKQLSCMGLYPKYETLCRTGTGGWFSIYGGNKLFGLISWKNEETQTITVDGFIHKNATGMSDFFINESLARLRKKNPQQIIVRTKISADETSTTEIVK